MTERHDIGACEVCGGRFPVASRNGVIPDTPCPRRCNGKLLECATPRRPRTGATDRDPRRPYGA